VTLKNLEFGVLTLSEIAGYDAYNKRSCSRCKAGPMPKFSFVGLAG